MTRNPPPARSPCNGVCAMDDASGLCIGCYRTLDEIATWSAMADANRRAVLDAMRVRRRQARLTAKVREVGR